MIGNLRRERCGLAVVLRTVASVAVLSAATRSYADGGDRVRVVHLPPGAVVGDGPPAGWSYRVIRSVPRLASGELSTLPDSATATATMFRTVIAVQVVERGGTHELSRIGLGNAIKLGGREVIVTREGPKAALSSLGFVQKQVLKEVEAALSQGRVIASTPTFVLYRSPATLIVGRRHEQVDINYALVVDSETGTLKTFTWASRLNTPNGPTEVIELAPGMNFDAPIDVRVTKWLGPVPLSWSFAIASLPPGRKVSVNPAAARMIAGAGLKTDAGSLERIFRGHAPAVAAR